MKRLPTTNIVQGQLGVHRVVAELLARGYAPYLPVVDSGIDILLASGIRLQVKTTRRPTQHWRVVGAWAFTLGKAQRIIKRQYVTSAPRTFSAEVDFVILHALEAKRFWIVPAPVLDGRRTVIFRDGVTQWKDIDLVEAQRLRDQGLSYQAIADALGSSHRTVMRRLKGIQTPKRPYAEMTQFENRWDLIAEMLAALQGSHAAAGAASQPASSGVEPVESPVGVEPA